LAAHGASVVAVALIVTVIPAIGVLVAMPWGVYQPVVGIVALVLSQFMRLGGC
jgi:hypothetical protein